MFNSADFFNVFINVRFNQNCSSGMIKYDSFQNDTADFKHTLIPGAKFQAQSCRMIKIYEI